MEYRLFNDTEGGTLTLVDRREYPTQMFTCHEKDNPYWERIKAEVTFGSDIDAVIELIDLAESARRRFEKVTERVSVKGGRVYFDNDEVDSSLADAIVRGMSEGDESFSGLAAFMDKIYQNPRNHSRENLYDWLKADATFEITPDGNLIGYKGLRNDLTSVHSGPGIVNGVESKGHLDNSLGNVIEMKRSEVEHDPGRACSYGLHVGTHGYASSFGSRVVKVLVNPRDVVSVPTDCNGQKMRVCRYKVVEIDTTKGSDLMAESYVENDDDWFEEYA